MSSVTVEILGAEVMRKRFEKIRAGSPIFKAVQNSTTRLQAHVMGQKLSNQVLHVRTGKLRRSITQKISASSDGMTGIVGTNTRYAAIHEFGGIIKHPPREMLIKLRETRKGALMRQEGFPNLARFAKKTHKMARESVVTSKYYEVHMPKRSFLKSSMEDLKPSIREELRNAIRLTIEGK